MGNELTITKENVLSAMSDHSLGEMIRPLTHEILLFDSYVAGTTHIKDETVFDEMKVGDKLILQREPDNRFDENAILVLDELHPGERQHCLCKAHGCRKVSDRKDRSH